MTSDFPFLADREPGETDTEYAERREHWRRVVAGERLATSTADLTAAELRALAAARTPPEHDYDYAED